MSHNPSDPVSREVSYDERVSVSRSGEQEVTGPAISIRKNTLNGLYRHSSTQTAVDATTQTQETESDVSKSTTPNSGKKSDGPSKNLDLTGIGRWYEKDSRKEFIDEAEWEGLPSDSQAKNFAITVTKSKTREHLTIWSKYLQALFRNKLSWTNGVSFDGESISFAEPYVPLYYHFDTLTKLVEEDKSPDAKPKDFEILRRFYDKWVKPYHDEIRSASRASNVRFENLWALFEPGKFLYTKDIFGQPQVYVIGASTFRGRAYDGKKFEETMLNDDFEDDLFSLIFQRDKQQGRFCVDCWGIEWNGYDRVFSRGKRTLALNQFTGTRSIQSLEFYPLENYAGGNESERNILLRMLEKRGQMWKQLVSGPPCVRHHNGAAWKHNVLDRAGEPKSGKKPATLDERVIVDHDGPKISTLNTEQTMANLTDKLMKMWPWEGVRDAQEKPVQQSILGVAFVELDGHAAEKPFTALQAQICPSTVNCASLANQIWYQVTVQNLTEVRWARESFERLVLDPKQKSMLQSMVEQHRKNRGHISGDLIQGKGKGLVVVLHGPPGVGKTLTAESVAEYTQKPLFSINISELTTEVNVVSNLQNIFEKASRWDAVLLLDEADVVLEQRSLEDLKRNGIVSVFLRMLEYYQGILFLTTNRLGTMDSAFISRIQIAVHFKSLNTRSRRAIWTNFIDGLNEHEAQGKDELYESLDDIAEWQLNGREIRNVITVAQSLAMGMGRRQGALRFDHVKTVAHQVLDFRDFVESSGRESRSRLPDLANHSWNGPGRPSLTNGSAARWP